MKNPISVLRTIGMLEAISFLVLMGIAMPLKYARGAHVPPWGSTTPISARGLRIFP